MRLMRLHSFLIASLLCLVSLPQPLDDSYNLPWLCLHVILIYCTFCMGLKNAPFHYFSVRDCNA
jgi:hypothetical protein